MRFRVTAAFLAAASACAGAGSDALREDMLRRRAALPCGRTGNGFVSIELAVLELRWDAALGAAAGARKEL